MLHLAFQKLYLSGEVGFPSNKASFFDGGFSYLGVKAFNLLPQP